MTPLNDKPDLPKCNFHRPYWRRGFKIAEADTMMVAKVLLQNLIDST